EGEPIDLVVQLVAIAAELDARVLEHAAVVVRIATAVRAGDDAAFDERIHLVHWCRSQKNDAAPVAAIALAGGLQAREHDRRAADAGREDLAAALDDERRRGVTLHGRARLDRQRAGGIDEVLTGHDVRRVRPQRAVESLVIRCTTGVQAWTDDDR